MVDIVERLKDMSEFRHMDRSQDEIDEIMREAADEITRLRSERDAAKAMCDEMAKEARLQALKEAEKAIGEHPGITYTNHRGNTDWRLASRQDFIDAIRALSESTPNPFPEQIANIGKEGGSVDNPIGKRG